MAKITIRTAAFVSAAAALLAAPTNAVILHPDDDPPTLVTPDNAVVGRWAGTASVVAIDPNYVITTRHQGAGVGTTVRVGGTNYVAAEIIDHPTADLRVVRIETEDNQDADLTDFVAVYDNLLSSELNQTLVLGGFGRGRGADIIGGPGPNDGDLIGYEWGGTGTRAQRWGTNQITAINLNVGVFDDTYFNDTLEATFEGPGPSAPGEAEATLAQADSGGGWFIFDDGQWKVAGLSQAVETEDENNPEQALFIEPETLSAVRLINYGAWIDSQVPEPSSLALFAAASVVVMTRRRH